MSKDLSFFEIGVLYAVREISINIFEIPSGIFADAFGRRKILASSFLIYIFAFITFYIGSDFSLFFIGMLLYALGDAIRTGINKSMIFEYLKRSNQLEYKVSYYGHTRSWSQIGSAVSSLVGGVLVFYQQNFDTIFLFSILPYILDFFNVLSYPVYLDEGIRKSKSLYKRLIITTSTFLNVIKNRTLLKTLVNVSIYSGYYKSIKDFIQPFLKSLLIQLPILLFLTEYQKMGLFLGLVYFFIFLNNSLAARKASQIAAYFPTIIKFLNYSLFIGIIVGLLSGLMMECLPSVFVVILFIIVLFIENSRKPSGVALITERSNEKVNASVISVSSQIASIFSAIFVLVIGYFADLLGVGISIAVMSLFILLLFPLIKLKK